MTQHENSIRQRQLPDEVNDSTEKSTQIFTQFNSRNDATTEQRANKLHSGSSD